MTEKNKMKKLIADIVAEINSIGIPDGLNHKDSDSLKSIKNDSEELQKLIENLNENILPRPVIRDGNGKLIKDHTPQDFYMKLQEEIFEVMEAQAYFDYETTTAAEEDVAEEIADIITVCISYLNANGYDEEKRSELFQKVNEKNEERGYFKESD